MLLPLLKLLAPSLQHPASTHTPAQEKPAPPATPVPLPPDWNRSYALHGDKQTWTYGLRQSASDPDKPDRLRGQ